MSAPDDNSAAPPIPGKRFFQIGEVSSLCDVPPHVLRYWEQEFPQLKPAKRRGNRRYYQRHDVLLVRQIKSLLHAEGFTIAGARKKLEQAVGAAPPPAARGGGSAGLVREVQEIIKLLD